MTGIMLISLAHLIGDPKSWYWYEVLCSLLVINRDRNFISDSCKAEKKVFVANIYMANRWILICFYKHLATSNCFWINNFLLHNAAFYKHVVDL